jgi:hypothetical protein
MTRKNTGRIRAILSDLLGVAALFAGLYLFLLFTA